MDQAGTGTGDGLLNVDVDALRAFAASVSEESAAVGSIESAARLSAAAATLAGSAVGAALARAAGPLRDAHRAFAGELSAFAHSASSNADDFTQAEQSIAGAMSWPAGGGTR
ncbi:hypothetical protein [Tomitella cavernea]|uniref:ESX-1 secretion-associated protein n=1 Tax=Tomitella cavernea TaxID=1387982 RepID=A0ABP9CY09_9ACTN|nr:hypothetical protein [Tomitella cavernea]